MEATSTNPVRTTAALAGQDARILRVTLIRKLLHELALVGILKMDSIQRTVAFPAPILILRGLGRRRHRRFATATDGADGEQCG